MVASGADHGSPLGKAYGTRQRKAGGRGWDGEAQRGTEDPWQRNPNPQFLLSVRVDHSANAGPTQTYQSLCWRLTPYSLIPGPS